MRKLIAATLVMAALTAAAGTEVVETRPIQHASDCHYITGELSRTLGASVITIVNTEILVMQRIPTPGDGPGASLLFSCSTPDRKLVVNRSWCDGAGCANF